MMMDQMIMDAIPESAQHSTAGHVPVMLKEIIEYLNPERGHICVDGTLGLGGHAQALLERIGPEGQLIGIDRDRQALSKAEENLRQYKDQCRFIYQNYRNMDIVLKELNRTKVDRILLDLGCSSFQLDNPDRGFGFKTEGPLDMRMDQESGVSAFDLINAYSEREISSILKEFGQERWHHRIARAIVYARSKKPIATTQELNDIIFRARPRGVKRGKIHPSTRTFQAFRIAVNRELEGLDEFMDKCVDLLNPGGRIGVIAFHSLEDRIVKHKFRAFNKAGQFNLIFKKPLRPSEEEMDSNPRARSARLRVAERIGA